jgi:hypothetical protein
VNFRFNINNERHAIIALEEVIEEVKFSDKAVLMKKELKLT